MVYYFDMNRSPYVIITNESGAHGGLFEYEFEKWFDVVDQITGEVVMTFQQHYEKSGDDILRTGVEVAKFRQNSRRIQIQLYGSNQIMEIELPQ